MRTNRLISWSACLAMLAALCLPSLLSPAAAHAGTYSVAQCSATNKPDWISTNRQDTAEQDGGNTVAALPQSGGKNFVSYNTPSSNTLSSGSYVARSDFGEYGLGSSTLIGSTNSPFQWGAEQMIAKDSLDAGPYRSPTVSGGIPESPRVDFHFTNYNGYGGGSCGQGQVARTGNVNSNDNYIYAVGYGSYAARRWNAPAGTSIKTIDGANLNTYSASEGCFFYGCNGSGAANRRPAKKYNRADMYWKSIMDNGGATQGFYGTGNDDHVGKTSGSGAMENQSPPQSNGSGYVSLYVQCLAVGGCVNSSHTENHADGADYLRARAALVPSSGNSTAFTLNDNNSGSAVVSAPSSSAWVRGDQTFSVTGDDAESGSGTVRLAWSEASGSHTIADQSWAGSDVSDGSRPSCSLGRVACSITQSITVNTASSSAGFSNGTHTVTASSLDRAGNPAATSSASFNVDNEVPGVGCSSAPSVAAPTGNSDNSGKVWVKGSVTVVASGCDRVSGLTTTGVEYQSMAPGTFNASNPSWSGNWNDIAACAATADVAATVSSVQRCAINSTAYPDGTIIRWRWKGTDLAGNAATSDASNAVYVDNTAPVVNGFSWQGWNGNSGQWEDITTGWTNATKTRVKWDAISLANGSPADKYYYSYDPDSETTTDSSCVTSQPSAGWQDATDVTESPDLIENRAQECRQGQHKFWLWVKDIAGNGANITSPVASDTAHAAGSSTISYDSVPTPQSRDESWVRADSLRPAGTKILELGWQSSNAFNLQWTNPSILNPVTEAPLLKAYYRVGGGALGSSGQLTDTQSYSACVISGAVCTVSGVKAPSEGSHPVRLWLMDAAGNTDLEMSGASQLNYRQYICVK